jgi:glutathione S-transferase
VSILAIRLPSGCGRSGGAIITLSTVISIGFNDPPHRLALHYAPESCARVVWAALEHVGAEFELKVVNKLAGEHLAEAFVAVNPKGKVPVLEADGRVLTENPAIHCWLAATYPDADLLPDRRDAVDALSLMSWFAAGIHPLVSRARFPWLVCDLAEAHVPIRRTAVDALGDAFAILEDRLRDREWLFSRWSIVDAYLHWLWFRAVGVGMDGARFEACSAHFDRTSAVPAVARMLSGERRIVRELELQGYDFGLPPLPVTRA